MWKSFLLSALVLAHADSTGRAAEPGDKQTRELLAVFRDPKNTPEVRSTALRALGALGWPGRDDVADVAKFLDDPEERKSARDTIGPYLVAIEALGRLGPAAGTAVPTLVKNKGIAAVYDQAIDAALESILVPPPGTAYTLLTSLRDNDPAVRLLAARTLRNYPVEYSVVAPLLRESVAKDPDKDVKLVAKETLEVLTKAEVDRLAQVLKDPDVNVRLLTAKALGGMGADAKSAVAALQAVVDNAKEDADVRAIARNAIQKINAKP